MSPSPKHILCVLSGRGPAILLFGTTLSPVLPQQFLWGLRLSSHCSLVDSDEDSATIFQEVGLQTSKFTQLPLPLLIASGSPRIPSLSSC